MIAVKGGAGPFAAVRGRSLLFSPRRVVTNVVTIRPLIQTNTRIH